MKSQTEIKILGYELKASSEAEFKSSSNQAIREKNGHKANFFTGYDVRKYFKSIHLYSLLGRSPGMSMFLQGRAFH